MKPKFTRKIMQIISCLRPVHFFMAVTLLIFSFQSIAQSPTAPALGFNVFLQKGATLINNETEGPVAMGGDLTLSQGSYQVSTNYAGSFKVNNVPVTLVIGGKVNFNGGNGLTVDQNGYVKIGSCGTSKVWYKDQNNAYSPIRITPGTDYNGSPRINLQANSQQLGVSESNNPICGQTVIDFNTAFTQMKASSASISACTDNTNLTNANGSAIPHTNLPNQVKINLHTGINTLNLAGADMNLVTDFIYNSKPDANHVLVINVNAPGAFTWKVYNSGGIGFQDCPYIFYNFYNTTTLNIEGNGAIEGTVFAPFADIVKTVNQSNIEGQIIAQSYVQNGGENHYPVFTTTIPGCGTVCNLSVSGTKTDITCNGAGNGAINITATGNNGTLTYLWNDGATTEDRANISAGNYSVQVSDAAGCKATSQTFTISQPLAINISASTTNVTVVNGHDGAINVTVTGGTGAYTYKWNDGATTEDRTGLSKGTYTVTVTDEHGCSESKAFSVNEPSCNLNVSGTKTDITCNGADNGAINITATGNNGVLTYLWNDGIATEDRTDLPVGSYSVQVSDAAGCKATSQTFTIGQPTAINISGTTVDVTTVSGSNGSIDITVTGGTGPYTYKWNDGATTEDRTGLPKGTYAVTVTDAHGCSEGKAFSVNEPNCNISVSGKANSITCNGSNNGSIDITVSNSTGNVSYVWNDAATTEDRTNLSEGNYSVQVADAVGCKATSETFTITEPTAIDLSGITADVTKVNGNDGSIDITVAGGTGSYTYKWNDGATTEDRTGLSKGNYSVIVTDANGCTATQAFVINQPGCNITLTGKVKPVTCFGGNDGGINVNVNGATGNVTYLWNDGVITEDRTNLSAGKYSVTVTDSKGCSVVSRTVPVRQPKKIKVSAVITGQKTKYVCDGTAQLSATGGKAPYKFIWADGYVGASRTGLCMASYTVTVQDKKGCTCQFKFRVPCEDTTINKGQSNASAMIASLSTKISVAPNPTTDVVRVTINAAQAGNATITVFDIAGKALIQQKINLSMGSNQHVINLGSFAKGIYNIRVITDNSSDVFKIVLN